MMQMQDVKAFAKKTSKSTTGRMAFYIALISLATTVVEGGIRIAELMLKKEQPSKVVVVKGGAPNEPFGTNAPPMMAATPNSPGIPAQPDEGTHVHEDSVFISKRVVFIILGLLVFLAGMELRRHLDRKKSLGG